MSRPITSIPPSGPLHLGHYRGALAPFVALQSDSRTAFLAVADLHLMASRVSRPVTAAVPDCAATLVAECLAAGVDADRCAFYRQSDVPELALINGLLHHLVTVEELLPQRGYARRAARADGPPSLGMLGWPVLEAADIIGTSATHVAIGAGNARHMEICHGLLTRLRDEWGIDLPDPAATVGSVDLPGLDGARKMSRSRGNCLLLGADEPTLRARVHTMAIRSEDGACVPAAYLAALGRTAEADRVTRGLTDGTTSPDEARELVLAAVLTHIAPIGRRVGELADDRSLLDGLLATGTERVRDSADATLRRLRRGLGLTRV
ncbi:hypothetical protein [Streptomyces sp. HF10]|uniref:hypothetical protein n=1 Tax=Streptomyces sp. HF10 TaxID=2692233 RepID=UPI001317A844|nr:hypothetical protein [Streptomyces sp. HF10]QHC32446.1 hypothetical protein GR129_30335 [Streptomyces sp. HF10]